MFAPLARGQEATPEFDPLGEHVDAPMMVRVMAEFIELPHEELTRLLLKPREGTDDTSLRGEVARLVEAGKATVVETMLCTGRSGMKSTAESVQEFIYPTEYEPPGLPGSFGPGNDQAKLEAVSDTRAMPLPTAFDPRNLGSTFEIEPTVSENRKLIDLRMQPEFVYHTGDTTWAEWKGPNGESPVKMPKFYRLAVNTAVVVATGQPAFVAALSPKDQDGLTDTTRKIMMFVRCDVLTVGR